MCSVLVSRTPFKVDLFWLVNPQSLSRALCLLLLPSLVIQHTKNASRNYMSYNSLVVVLCDNNYFVACH